MCRAWSSLHHGYGREPNPRRPLQSLLKFAAGRVESREAVLEIALFFLLGQGVVHLLAGESRAANTAYRTLVFLNRPAWWLTRLLAPRIIIDRHIAILSFFVTLLLWALLVAARIYLYAHNGH